MDVHTAKRSHIYFFKERLTQITKYLNHLRMEFVHIEKYLLCRVTEFFPIWIKCISLKVVGLEMGVNIHKEDQFNVPVYQLHITLHGKT